MELSETSGVLLFVEAHQVKNCRWLTLNWGPRMSSVFDLRMSPQLGLPLPVLQITFISFISFILCFFFFLHAVVLRNCVGEQERKGLRRLIGLIDSQRVANV